MPGATFDNMAFGAASLCEFCASALTLGRNPTGVHLPLLAALPARL